ncbi:MAG: hypothetical protein A2268_15350 [Candidatus Raymondbacteria bacterium RifOxyA12_full_50_37]|uniref:Carbamoyltransferase n=1 Tax=Candidatus Raymondbacteria bacterium RIFOXYD12_FULL_49_13 TaxID=1817890 RepID=A0A1F7F6U5_UNCRA|nr:MAG: hypothetical protein A2268_15350 [Candidatus Raymondbacteria bacterium RifOxyA12_full_50_37]OGJ88471.1 MAG: hypothetical protein A2248_19915 [Candidatus Raymondbacteria bacterium RIFOXYA2_FULL_49_16]OGJ90646.1 MAG: hypothetical protein A2350_18600 [Candidatus Raymondbacteria bacterium RifOxyB12_full_50_8]OGJ98931.1 MAG: hypothetical protein A2453_10630 [Candidatus Raymondbacteria bacterium RIFOXYC2_FULL_50_21]OGK02369.1 MAG: hypothetical protein A2519_15985 [Candidatus Raymondbacteria b
MNILGISCFYHDSAAALVQDGEIIAAAQEERFTRKKHDPRFPANAAAYCLREAGISAKNLDYIVYYDKPLLSFERLLLTYLSIAPTGIVSFIAAMPLWLGQKLHIPKIVRKELDGFQGPVLFTEHHEAHAASAFYPSPFEEAAILTVDGVGEWATASYGIGNGNELMLLKELHFPDSLGLLYSAFTYFTGFRINSGEYKLMGLAPYGKARFKELILREIVDMKDDGSLRLNMKYFNFLGGLKMTNAGFAGLFGGPARMPESPITTREMDIAASIQAVTEEAMVRMANHVHHETGLKNLCLAGGVALNCVANSRILHNTSFENIWIQPAAGDAGGALGSALAVWHRFLGNGKKIGHNGLDSQKGSLLGPAFSEERIREVLEKSKAIYKQHDKSALAFLIAQEIACGKIIGLFSSRMEYGPRALGNRSILGDARNPEMQSKMNLKIKFRESFRPFAPAVLEERAREYFDTDSPSPYMLFVAKLKQHNQQPVDNDEDILDRLKFVRSSLPAITHLDYTARLQTVNNNSSEALMSILQAFDKLTGCPVLINTSFNVRGEPIVCTPEDAYRCFMRTDLDVLVLEDFILKKNDQPAWNEDVAWKKDLVLD